MLTTTQAPFIETARQRGELYIDQPYELYDSDNHRAWSALYTRMKPQWEQFATQKFLEGLEALKLDSGRVPHLDEVNRFLEGRTGFRARAVSGYVPAFLFFDALRRREFPTTITVRALESLDYLPEPDVFHDLAGHVPMHTDPAFAQALVRFGECARAAAERARMVSDPFERIAQLTSNLKALARFFWFTVEFGLMRSGDGLKAYGSGLLSSFGELEFALTSPRVHRADAQLDWMIHQGFEIDHYQPLLFVIESFDHLYEMAGELGRWMSEGRLDFVAPGEPGVSAQDLESFLKAE